LEPFAKQNADLLFLYKAMRKNLWWYDRVYASIRSQLALRFEANGKEFRQ
jgi:hypothetical protein